MIGGKLIGQGTYGCVFQPPLVCKKKQLPKSMVGKITAEQDFDVEMKAKKILSGIKEYKDYFLLPEDVCSPRVKSAQIDPDLSKCHVAKGHDISDFKQLSMPYGGVDVYKYSLMNKEHIPFFTLMRHLLEAGSLMLLHGFVHFDISAKNILIDKFGIPRIIDFGQSFSIHELSLQSIRNTWTVLGLEYPTEPPEITFLKSLDEFNKYSFDDTIKLIMPKKNVLYLIEKLLGIPVKEQIASLVKFFKSSIAFHNQDIVKFWKLYYTGFDSWAIGIILLTYLNKMLVSYEFIESSEWKLKSVLIVDILTKMLDVNPKERIDCVEALSILDPFNDIYLEYGVEWVTKRNIQRRKN
jgi:hypothetical protein